MKARDFKGLFEKNTIRLIRSKNEVGDIFTFEFNFDKDLDWIAGQHAIFTIPDKKISGKKFRAFSIASAKNEKKIIISTKISSQPSSFKHSLKNLIPGETVNMRGPFGWFYVRDYSKPVAMIAGGIGITPIRGIMKGMESDSHFPKSTTLFFADSNGYFPFKDELVKTGESIPSFDSHFIKERKELTYALEAFAKEHGDKATYFISGSPSMIKGVRKLLKSSGVSGSSMVNDPFFGY